jgi:threonine synthase
LSDDEIRAAWGRLAREEGAFCEPASAAGFACVESTQASGRVAVAILTGHGLKDAGAVDQSAEDTVEPTLEAVLEAIA